MNKKRIIIGLFMLFCMSLFVTGTVKAFDFELVGDTSFINDSQAYISATPHEMTNGCVEVEFKPKSYTGNVNALIGVDSNNMIPKQTYKYFNDYVDIDKSLTCDYDNSFYNVSNGVVNCYVNNVNGTVLMWTHTYDSYNLDTNTIYWTEQQYKEWDKIYPEYTKFNYEFDNKDNWYYIQNIPVTANQLQKYKICSDVKYGTSGKYDIAFYPSSYGLNINSAIISNAFYLLDPVYNSTYSYYRESQNLTNSSYYDLILPYKNIDIDNNGTDEWFYAQYGSISYNDGDDFVFNNATSLRCGFRTYPSFVKSCSSISNGLVHYWTYDESSGNAIDTISSAHGTLNGDIIQNVNGKIHKGYEFDGNEDYLTMGTSAFAETGDFSISLWLKADDFDALYILASKFDTWSSTNMMWQLNLADAESIKIERSGSQNDFTIPTLSAGVWYHVVLTHEDNVKDYFYIDGSVQNTSTLTVFSPGPDTTAATSIGAYPNNQYSFDGVIDDFRYYNRVLTQSDVDTLYEKSLNVYYGDEVESGVILPQMDIIFKNVTGVNKTLFDEGENFYTYLNLTLDNGTILNNSNCSINLELGILEEPISDNNFSLCNSGCNYSEYSDNITFDDKNSTSQVVNDSLHFSACHLNNPIKTLTYNVSCSSGSFQGSVGNGGLPLCSSGFANFNIKFNECIDDYNLTVTFTTDASSPSNGIRVYNGNLDRQFYNHLNEWGTDVLYNYTSNLYYTPHTHEYYVQGSYNITGICVNSNSSYNINYSEEISIINLPPRIEYTGILAGGVFQPTTGTGFDIYEYYNGLWYILGFIEDEDYVESSVNISYANGTIFFSESYNTTGAQTPVLVNSSFLTNFNNMPFYAQVDATDSFNATATFNVSFNLTDTVNPVCTGISNTTAYIGYNHTLDITCTDEALLSFNLTCNNGITNYSVFDPVTTTSFNFANQFNMTNSSVTCDLTVYDGHLTALNSYTTTFIITGRVMSPYTLKRFSCDLSTTGMSIGIVGFALIMVLIWMFTVYIRIPIISLFVGFVMCFFAWTVAACFFFANVIFIILGVVTIAQGIALAMSGNKIV